MPSRLRTRFDTGRELEKVPDPTAEAGHDVLAVPFPALPQDAAAALQAADGDDPGLGVHDPYQADPRRQVLLHLSVHVVSQVVRENDLDGQIRGDHRVALFEVI